MPFTANSRGHEDGLERLNTEGTSQPGSKEAQRLQAEATKSKPGQTTPSDDSPQPGTEGVPDGSQ